MRKFLRIAAAAVLALVVCCIAAAVWANSRAAAQERTWRQEIALERARIAALRMPVLRGDPVEGNAAAGYFALIRAMDDRHRKGDSDAGSLSAAAKAGPAVAFLPEVTQFLNEHRTDAVAIRESTRRSRVDWEFQYEDPFRIRLPSLQSSRLLVSLLILEGHEHSRNGDLEGAADRYLDAVRVGADYGTSGVLSMDLIGIAIAQEGLNALSSLLTTQDPDGLPLARIEADLNRLEPVLPDVIGGLRGERILAAGLGTSMGSPVWAAATGLSLPRSVFAILAQFPAQPAPLLRRMEAAAVIENPAETVRVSVEAAEFVKHSWNPIAAIAIPDPLRPRLAADELKAQFRLALTAVRLEGTRRREGRYPAALAELPVDPLAYPAKLHFQLTGDGRGYKLWSAGRDSKDNGGARNDDIVLERKPPSGSVE